MTNTKNTSQVFSHTASNPLFTRKEALRLSAFAVSVPLFAALFPQKGNTLPSSESLSTLSSQAQLSSTPLTSSTCQIISFDNHAEDYAAGVLSGAYPSRLKLSLMSTYSNYVNPRLWIALESDNTVEMIAGDQQCSVYRAPTSLKPEGCNSIKHTFTISSSSQKTLRTWTLNDENGTGRWIRGEGVYGHGYHGMDSDELIRVSGKVDGYGDESQYAARATSSSAAGQYGIDSEWSVDTYIWDNTDHNWSPYGTHYMHWNIFPRITIQFMENLGSETNTPVVSNLPSIQYKLIGHKLALSSSLPQRPRFLFRGWDTSASSKIIGVIPSQEINCQDWNGKSRIYNTSSWYGSGEPVNSIAFYESALYPSPSGSNIVPLYAKWTPCYYSVYCYQMNEESPFAAFRFREIENLISSSSLKEAAKQADISSSSWYIDPQCTIPATSSNIPIEKDSIPHCSGIQGKEIYYYPIYDYSYYRNSYSDLRNAFGNNRSQYLNHFLNHGLNEGRLAAAYFNAKDYRKINSADLDSMSLYNAALHFCEYGIQEGRFASYESEPLNTEGVIRLYISSKLSVSYMVDNEELSEKSESSPGASFNVPENITTLACKENCDGFSGWFLNKECTTPWKDGTILKENIILYGKNKVHLSFGATSETERLVSNPKHPYLFFEDHTPVSSENLPLPSSLDAFYNETIDFTSSIENAPKLYSYTADVLHANSCQGAWLTKTGSGNKLTKITLTGNRIVYVGWDEGGLFDGSRDDWKPEKN